MPLGCFSGFASLVPEINKLISKHIPSILIIQRMMKMGWHMSIGVIVTYTQKKILLNWEQPPFLKTVNKITYSLILYVSIQNFIYKKNDTIIVCSETIKSLKLFKNKASYLYKIEKVNKKIKSNYCSKTDVVGSLKES